MVFESIVKPSRTEGDRKGLVWQKTPEPLTLCANLFRVVGVNPDVNCNIYDSSEVGTEQHIIRASSGYLKVVANTVAKMKNI